MLLLMALFHFFLANPPVLIFFFRIALVILDHLWFHMNFRTISSGSVKNVMGNLIAAAAAKSLQSCPTLCDPRDGSPPGSSVPGILQARTLEWVAISFSRNHIKFVDFFG